MSALAFLVRKQFINFFRDLFHHPGKLITYIFSVAVILFALLVPGTKAAKPTSQATDIRILHGIYLGILLLLSVPSLFSALKSGTTMFKMSDVNFLFVSPLSPKHILNYGLLKQMTTTLTMFLFVLCYSGTLMELFRIGPSGVVILIIGLAATLFFVQVLSLLIYSYANGNPKRKGQVRSVLILFFGLMALTFLYVFRQNGSGVEGLLAALGSRQLEYFPVIGWAKGFTFALGVHDNDRKACRGRRHLLCGACFRNADKPAFGAWVFPRVCKFRAFVSGRECPFGTDNGKSQQPRPDCDDLHAPAHRFDGPWDCGRRLPLRACSGIRGSAFPRDAARRRLESAHFFCYSLPLPQPS